MTWVGFEPTTPVFEWAKTVYALDRVAIATGLLHNIIIMVLQPFVGPWPLFQFLDPIHSRQVSLDGGSARRKASTYTHNTD
jgi:hypothetical protein